MRGLALVVVAAALPTPALACTIFWKPFSETIERHHLTVRAMPSIAYSRHEKNSDGYVTMAGTLTLTEVRCIHRPKGYGPCPDTITVAFAHQEDSSSCPHPLRSPRERLRYFSLYQHEGEWQVGHAARTFRGRE